MMVKVFGVTPNRASGCMSCMTRCLTRCCMRLLNICLLYHTLHLEERYYVVFSEITRPSYAVPCALVCLHGSVPSVGNLAHPRACHLERSGQPRWWHVHPDYSSPQTRCSHAR